MSHHNVLKNKTKVHSRYKWLCTLIYTDKISKHFNILQRLGCLIHFLVCLKKWREIMENDSCESIWYWNVLLLQVGWLLPIFSCIQQLWRQYPHWCCHSYWKFYYKFLNNQQVMNRVFKYFFMSMRVYHLHN